MFTDLLKEIGEMLVLMIVTYFGFRSAYKSKKVYIEWKVMLGLLNLAPLYIIYLSIQFYSIWKRRDN